MASITLDELWLHEADDNDVYVNAILSQERERTQKAGEVRRYAGGRLRSVTRAGSSQTIDVEMTLVDRSDIDTIRGWVEDGTQLMYREPRGRILWGVILDYDVQELPGVAEDVADVSFTFLQSTYTLEV